MILLLLFLFQCPIYAEHRAKCILESSIGSLKTAFGARNQSLCQNVSKWFSMLQAQENNFFTVTVRKDV